jgi:hypothetical protein
MRRDQEGRQRQGLRTIFKPLKNGTGKRITVDDIEEVSMFGLMKGALIGRRF